MRDRDRDPNRFRTDDDDDQQARERPTELKIAGLHAALAAFERRPDDVLRAYLVEERLDAFREELAAMARARKPYRVVPPDELDRVAGTTHHEGICVVTRPIRELPLDELCARTGPSIVLAAPGLENPHNLGAILRIGAHFGVDAILLEESDPRLGPATCRVAEGGAEHVALVRVPRMGPAMQRLRAAGYGVLATSSHVAGAKSLHEVAIPQRMVWLVGSESRGLPRGAFETADAIVTIPGTGRVESLNVATATAVLLAETLRRRR